MELKIVHYFSVKKTTASKVLYCHNYALGKRNFAKKEELIYETSKSLPPMPAILCDNTCAILPCDIYGAKIPFP